MSDYPMMKRLIVQFPMIAVLALVMTLAVAPAMIPGAGGQAHAGSAVPLLEDADHAARLRNLEYELRCLVCQAESVAESNSEFADDIRRQAARMIEDGMTDQQIRDFMVQRYGDFILFRPPVNTTTYLLWGGPMLLLAIGLVVMGFIMMRRRKSGDVGISNADHERARALLAERGGKGDDRQ